MDWTIIGWATLAGLATGLATLVGASPALFAGAGIDRHHNAMLGFAAGVMVSASYLSLIVPAAEFAQENGSGAGSAALMVAISVLVGALTLDLLRRASFFKPPPLGRADSAPELKSRVWLLIIAMTGHNLPEGAAVGVGFAAGDQAIAISTAIGIGVQNIPEGMAVAAALLTIGASRGAAVLIGGATGLVEPLGAFVGASLVSLVQGLLPAAMGWAAGAMLYICVAELIPAVHADKGSSRGAIAATMIGLAAMALLDIALS